MNIKGFWLGQCVCRVTNVLLPGANVVEHIVGHDFLS